MLRDRKVYDSDLVLTPILREIAHTYAREYVGNFDMMIEARAFIIAHGTLNDGMYRPILNTLRTDVLRADLWGAVQSLLEPIRRQPLPKEWEDQPKAKVVPIRPESRRVILDTAVLIKYPFGMARPQGRSHRVIHRPNQAAFCRWQRPRDAHGREQMDKPMVMEDLWVKWLCCHGYPRNPILLQEVPDGMKECRQCYCIAHDIEYP